MALFSRSLPRRAVLGALVGFLYSLIILLRGELLPALGWFLLSIALLFARPISYYGYLTWAILWLVWRGVAAFQGKFVSVALAVVDVVVPLLSVALLSSSGYLESLQPPPEDEPIP